MHGFVHGLSMVSCIIFSSFSPISSLSSQAVSLSPPLCRASPSTPRRKPARSSFSFLAARSWNPPSFVQLDSAMNEGVFY